MTRRCAGVIDEKTTLQDLLDRGIDRQAAEEILTFRKWLREKAEQTLPSKPPRP